MKNRERKTILIIGTGTIGFETIRHISLFANMPTIEHKLHPYFDWEEIIFHKHKPLKKNIPRMECLLSTGREVRPRLCVNEDKVEDFKKIMGLTPHYTLEEALERADVIIDATPFGRKNKKLFYEKYAASGKIFIAQGSEFRKDNPFGDIFIGGFINGDAVLEKLQEGKQQFYVVGSCNAHMAARAIKVALNTFGMASPVDIEGLPTILSRSDDSNKEKTQASLRYQPFDEEYAQEGSYHAWTVLRAFESMGYNNLDIETNNVVKIPDNVMHGVPWRIVVHNNLFYPKKAKDSFIEAIKKDPFCAMTRYLQTNEPYGESKYIWNYYQKPWFLKDRCYAHIIFCLPTIGVIQKRGGTVVKFCTSTPQETNAILSNIEIACMAKDPERFNAKAFYEFVSPLLEPKMI